MGAAYLLPRIVGLGRATELLILGNKIDARRAYEIGLATEVVPEDDLHTAAAGLAQRLADGPRSPSPRRSRCSRESKTPTSAARSSSRRSRKPC